mmetsp:Transcript_4783/g.12852  ORF Transcript_4783/g.12852 Transcript_4783/m.12852 type:complete len:263 (+) Transcript_4783:613-1401(+)
MGGLRSCSCLCLEPADGLGDVHQLGLQDRHLLDHVGDGVEAAHGLVLQRQALVAGDVGEEGLAALEGALAVEVPREAAVPLRADEAKVVAGEVGARQAARPHGAAPRRLVPPRRDAHARSVGRILAAGQAGGIARGLARGLAGEGAGVRALVGALDEGASARRSRLLPDHSRVVCRKRAVAADLRRAPRGAGRGSLSVSPGLLRRVELQLGSCSAVCSGLLWPLDRRQPARSLLHCSNLSRRLWGCHSRLELCCSRAFQGRR